MCSEKERQNSFGKSRVIWQLKIKMTSHLNQRSEGERRCSGANLTAPCSVPQSLLPRFCSWFSTVSCARNKTRPPSGSLTFASTQSPQVDGPRTRGILISFFFFFFSCARSVALFSSSAALQARPSPRPGGGTGRWVSPCVHSQAASSRPRQPASPRPGRNAAGAGAEAAAGCRCSTPFPRPPRRGWGRRRGAARSPLRKPPTAPTAPAFPSAAPSARPRSRARASRLPPASPSR